jgi:molecular chaperone GrpE
LTVHPTVDHPSPTESPEGAPNDDATAGDEVGDPRTAELEDHLRRALADLDNLRKRFDREVARERAAERAMVAGQLIPVIDDLERALLHADADPTSVIEGVRAVHHRALDALTRLGFPRFDDLGRPFDPVRHEAVSAVDSDADSGTVVAAVRPGYGTEDSILRPASVVVARRPG